MSRFTAVDLSQLAAPDVVETLDYEAILAEVIEWIRTTWDALRLAHPELPALDTLGLETEPMTVIAQALAYRELLLRARINDAARAVMVAFSTGSDLDHLGALFGVSRLVVTPATVDTAVVMEDDERLRRRIQLAPDAYSTAGARGAYIYHALTYSAQIADAWAWSPRDGEVHVAVIGAAGAAVSDENIAGLIEFFARENVRPLTDIVTVRRAETVSFDVSGTLIIERGPDATLIRDKAVAAVRAYAAARCRIGVAAYRTGLIGAARVGGVDDVVLAAPAADVVCADQQIPVLGTITLSFTLV